jgi:Leucine-rich repeat (LRR) protein
MWNGIGCDNSASSIKVSEIYLSGRNLTRSGPEDIAQLTALINVSLDNNHLMGSLPNFSNLTMLERLYLQKNNFSGTVEWLSDLKNLKELNIENNNFSGVIPAQLLLNCSLKLN